MTINGGTVMMSRRLLEGATADRRRADARTSGFGRGLDRAGHTPGAARRDVRSEAVAAGGNGVVPPADMFWGDRFAIVIDPFGHRWMIVAPLKT